MRNALTLITMLTLTACSLKDKPVALQSGDNATVGVKSFRQLYQQLSYVTGLTAAANSVVRTNFNAGQSVLSGDGDAETTSATMILAMTSLTGVFCDQFVKAEAATPAASRRIYVSIDFTKDQRSLTEATRRELIEKFAGAFWQRKPRDEETGIMLQALAEAETGRPYNTTETKSLAVLPCVLAGSSLDALKH